MKKTGSIIFTVLMLVSWNVFSQASAPFTKGVVFATWFDPRNRNSVQEIPFGRFVEQDFVDLKKLGIDVIRLAIHFEAFTSAAPRYIIDPFFFKLLDKAVDWAEKYQIYIIFVNGAPDEEPVIDNSYRSFLLSIWTQMAEHYKNRSEYVIYEILNEPAEIAAEDWGKMQGDVIDAIRKIDKNHWIVVSGVEWSAVKTLSLLPNYTDKKLLYTFHFYDPDIFTHQGAGWMESPVVYLTGVPFPYDKNRMPKIPKEVKGTWVENKLQNYSTIGTEAELAKIIDQAADFAKQRNVPVFCGEFGVYMRNSPPKDRVRWHQFVREAFEARNIPWVITGYDGPFGILNPPNGVNVYSFNSFKGDINTDLNVELVRALGLNPPPQVQKEQLKTDFTIYNDYLNYPIWYSSKEHIVNTFYTPSAEGEYAIQWGNINRKNDELSIGITPIRDLTYLAQNGFVLEFKAKTAKPLSFIAYFVADQNNTNWIIQYTIDQKQLTPDGQWHTIRIPLRDMQVFGGFDKTKRVTVKPKSKNISWVNVTALTFQTLNEDGDVCEIFLDSIKVTK